jgi:hypothetical protein
MAQCCVHNMYCTCTAQHYIWIRVCKNALNSAKFHCKMPRDSAKFRGISCISLKKFRLPPEVKKTTSMDILIGIEYFFFPMAPLCRITDLDPVPDPDPVPDSDRTIEPSP